MKASAAEMMAVCEVIRAQRIADEQWARRRKRHMKQQEALRTSELEQSMGTNRRLVRPNEMIGVARNAGEPSSGMDINQSMSHDYMQDSEIIKIGFNVEHPPLPIHRMLEPDNH